MTAVRLAAAPAARGSYDVYIIGTAGAPTDGYDLAADVALPRHQASGQLNAAGEAVVNLLPTTSITPAGTRYRADLKAVGGGVAVQVIFTVPASASQVNALDHLAEVPGALASPALDAHATAADPHAGYVLETPVAATSAQRAVVANGLSKPLSGFYATLAAAQADYPAVSSLTQQLDWAVAQKALNDNLNVRFSLGTWIISSALTARTGQVIDATGATIRQATNATGMPGLLVIGEGVTGVRVDGGTWDGNRFNMTTPNPDYQYVLWAGIRFQGCRDVKVFNATVINVWSHGFFMGGQVDPKQVTADIDLTGCKAYGNMDGGFSCRPGCINISITDAVAFGNSSSGIQIIRSDWVNVVGAICAYNGPDASAEGDGIDWQGARYCSGQDILAYGNQRAGALITQTAEPGNLGTWRAAWSNATTNYVASDVVTYNGLTWIAKGAVPVATPPTEFAGVGDSDPYWRQCPYDAGGIRNSLSIQLTSVRGVQNYCFANRGKYDATATYNYTDSVYFTSGGVTNVYAWRLVTAGSAAPTPGATDANWTLQTDGSTGASKSWGIKLDNCTDCTLNSCEASYNGGTGWGQGLVIHAAVLRLVVNDLRAVGNPNLQVYSENADSTANSPIAFNDLYLDGAGISSNNVQLAQSATFKGGTIRSASAANIRLRGDLASQTLVQRWTFEGVTIQDAGGSWPGVFLDGPRTSAACHVHLLDCTFPNSTTMGNAYQETLGAGTAVSRIDRCALGTTTRPTVVTDGFTLGFSYAASRLGPSNVALPGSTGVTTIDETTRAERRVALGVVALTGSTSTGEQVAPSFKASGKTGATATPITLAGGTASGAPTTGAHVKGEVVLDDTGKLWYCTVAGTPGTWVQSGGGAGITPTLVTSAVDPMTQNAAQAMPGANELFTFRVRPLSGPKTVTKVYYRSNVASGNVDVAIFSLAGTTLTRLASSGPVVMPAAGETEVTLSAAVTFDPSLVYFLGLACDNITASFFVGSFSVNFQNLPSLGGFGYRHHTRAALTIGATESIVTNALASERGYILAAK